MYSTTKFIVSKFVLLLLMLWVNHISAQTVKPMIMELAPHGSGAQTAIRMKNTTAKPLTVEITPFHLEMDERGQENLSPAENDILVIPMTAVIPPNATQVVRVIYIGDTDIIHSRAYRVAFKQVPASFDASEKTVFQITVAFNTLVNVSPPNSVAQLVVRSINNQSSGLWQLEIENIGKRYARLSTTQWVVTDSRGKQQSLSGRQARALLDGNLVLPGNKRIFNMKPIEGFAPKDATIRIYNGDE